MVEYRPDSLPIQHSLVALLVHPWQAVEWNPFLSSVRALVLAAGNPQDDDIFANFASVRRNAPVHHYDIINWYLAYMDVQRYLDVCRAMEPSFVKPQAKKTFVFL